MSRDLSELVKYRVERSKEALKDSKILVREQRRNASANRLYYWLFYVVSAYLLKKGIMESTHSGMKSKFNAHLIKSGLIPRSFGNFYNYFFNLRQDADYQDFIELDSEDILPYLTNVEELLNIIKNLILE